MHPLNFFTRTAFTLGLLGLATHRKHLVSALLCIESMMLTLFISLTTLVQTVMTSNNIIYPVLLLAFAACGAGVGLALLVATSRTHALCQLKSLNLLKC